jgi:lysophospholipase L1-like esterase
MMLRAAAAALFVTALAACATGPTVPAPTRFQDVIAGFEAADVQAMPPKCAVLFTGSSSIRFWRTLEQDFPNRTVINRGFGGSTIAEVNGYFSRIVAPYKPSAIVFYAGENDINAGTSAVDAFADFETFMALKDRALGSTPVWYISAKPSKLRTAQIPAQADLNARIKWLADQRNDLAYIDVVEAMLKPDDSPKDIFVEDDLHMTPEGYAIWTPIVEASLGAGQVATAKGC